MVRQGLGRCEFLESHRVSSNHMAQGIKEQVGTIPTVKAEAHLVQVGLQMLGAEAMPRSNDAALEKRKGRAYA